MNIRTANESDYPELRALFLEARRSSFWWDNTEAMRLEDFDISTQDELILVAEGHDRIMGFMSLYLPDHFIHNLFVHPECSGNGAGGQLLKAAAETMGRPMKLKCVSKNEKALKFYERNGWKKLVEEGAPGEEKYWVMVYE